jgi:hypothetical protein
MLHPTLPGSDRLIEETNAPLIRNLVGRLRGDELDSQGHT